MALGCAAMGTLLVLVLVLAADIADASWHNLTSFRT